MTIDLREGILAGHPRAVARAITLAESGGDVAFELVEALRPHARKGVLVGLTGSPGAGKSSLIGKLAKEFRTRGKTVGILAVDPSSPFSGGAVLGDRVRMQEIASDPEVFVRSMGSRGRPGGLAAAVEDAAVILKAAGKDIVLVETVGVGQGELDVAGAVQTVIVVLTPGMGDEVQSMKAGLLEVADVYVVNKSDLPGADTVARSLHILAGQNRGAWQQPVIQTSVVSGAGIVELADAVEGHSEYLANRSEVSEQDIKLTYKTILSQAGRLILDDLEATLDEEQLRHLAARVAVGYIDPREAAREAINQFFSKRMSGQPARRSTVVTGAPRNGIS